MAKRKRRSKYKRRVQKGGNSPIYRRQTTRQPYYPPRQDYGNSRYNKQYDEYDRMLRRYENIIKAKKEHDQRRKDRLKRKKEDDATVQQWMVDIGISTH